MVSAETVEKILDEGSKIIGYVAVVFHLVRQKLRKKRAKKSTHDDPKSEEEAKRIEDDTRFMRDAIFSNLELSQEIEGLRRKAEIDTQQHTQMMAVLTAELEAERASRATLQRDYDRCQEEGERNEKKRAASDVELEKRDSAWAEYGLMAWQGFSIFRTLWNRDQAEKKAAEAAQRKGDTNAH